MSSHAVKIYSGNKYKTFMRPQNPEPIENSCLIFCSFPHIEWDVRFPFLHLKVLQYSYQWIMHNRTVDNTRRYFKDKYDRQTYKSNKNISLRKLVFFHYKWHLFVVHFVTYLYSNVKNFIQNFLEISIKQCFSSKIVFPLHYQNNRKKMRRTKISLSE